MGGQPVGDGRPETRDTEDGRSGTGNAGQGIPEAGYRKPEIPAQPKLEAEPAVEVPSTLIEANESIDEVAESAFRAEAKARGELPVMAVKAAVEVEENGPLPKLDDLVKRIPAEVLETLDDLFRAKFVTVKRVPEKALK